MPSPGPDISPSGQHRYLCEQLLAGLETKARAFLNYCRIVYDEGGYLFVTIEYKCIYVPLLLSGGDEAGRVSSRTPSAHSVPALAVFRYVPVRPVANNNKTNKV